MLSTKVRLIGSGALAVLMLSACGGAVAASNVPTTAPRTGAGATTPATAVVPSPPSSAVTTPPAPTTTPALPSSSAPEAPPTSAAPPVLPAGAVVVTQVIDGDTIVIDTGEHVRFIGIDTPEVGHCGADAATRNMRNLVYGKAVILFAGARDNTDKYGRLLRYVDLPDGTDTGLAQIQAGLAIARYDSRDGYGHHPREEQYIAADTGAARACIGSSPAPSSAPSSAPASGDSVYYANCAAARAAGAAPLHRGDPGYRSALDRDNDGVACE
jgi:endonuclease YncB( thermonuclease family)